MSGLSTLTRCQTHDPFRITSTRRATTSYWGCLRAQDGFSPNRSRLRIADSTFRISSRCQAICFAFLNRETRLTFADEFHKLPCALAKPPHVFCESFVPFPSQKFTMFASCQCRQHRECRYCSASRKTVYIS